MKLDSYRSIDRFYSRMSARAPLSQHHMERWMRIRAWLVENDTQYIWAD